MRLGAPPFSTVPTLSRRRRFELPSTILLLISEKPLA